MIIHPCPNFNVEIRGWLRNNIPQKPLDVIHYGDVIMSTRLKSPAFRLFTQPFVQVQIKENIKAPRHWPLCGEFTGDRWIPRTKGQYRGKCFHLMTSSCTYPCPPNPTQTMLVKGASKGHQGATVTINHDESQHTISLILEAARIDFIMIESL